MTKLKQVKKNLILSQKLATFLVTNPKFSKTSSESTSYVPFSAKDLTLNKLNKRIVKDLIKEGKKVIEASETKDKDNPWTFNYL